MRNLMVAAVIKAKYYVECDHLEDFILRKPMIASIERQCQMMSSSVTSYQTKNVCFSVRLLNMQINLQSIHK